MGLGGGQEAVAPGEVQHHGEPVGHAAGGGPEGGLVAQEPGHPVLQRGHGGVAVQDVVAHLRFGHGFAHGGIGPGDGVGTEIEGAHAHD